MITYSYTVTARDKSVSQNATAPSAAESATIPTAIMVDDFTSNILNANWIISSVLTAGGSPAIFDTTTNDNQLSIMYNGGTYHQTVMLRNDYTLSIGQTLKVDRVSGVKAGLCLVAE